LQAFVIVSFGSPVDVVKGPNILLVVH